MRPRTSLICGVLAHVIEKIDFGKVSDPEKHAQNCSERPKSSPRPKMLGILMTRKLSDFEKTSKKASVLRCFEASCESTSMKYEKSHVSKEHKNTTHAKSENAPTYRKFPVLLEASGRHMETMLCGMMLKMYQKHVVVSCFSKESQVTSARH